MKGKNKLYLSRVAMREAIQEYLHKRFAKEEPYVRVGDVAGQRKYRRLFHSITLRRVARRGEGGWRLAWVRERQGHSQVPMTSPSQTAPGWDLEEKHS